MKKLESTVLLVITKSIDRWGNSAISVQEIQNETGYGRTSVSKAISNLSTSGYIKVTRTKRNLGRLYKNKYTLIK
jgi:biotin operon repressor